MKKSDHLDIKGMNGCSKETVCEGLEVRTCLAYSRISKESEELERRLIRDSSKR